MNKILSHKIVQKIKHYCLAHKKTSAAGLVVLILLGYWGYKSFTNTSGETRYVTAAAEKGAVILSVSGSGQVSASNQVDLKAKTSGDVVYIGVKSGQVVRAGTLLAQLDTRDAQKTVRDAEANLASARLSLEKLKKPADALASLQAENSLVQAQEALTKSYDDAFNSVSNAYLDLPGIMTGFENILYGTEAGQGGQSNVSAYADMAKNYSDDVLRFRDDAITKYQTARKTYSDGFDKYKASTRFDGAAATQNLVNQTYDSAKTISDALKSSSDFLNLAKDLLTQKKVNIPSAINTHLTSLGAYTGTTNTNLGGLLNMKNTMLSSERAVAEKTASLAKLKAGADDLDVKSQEISLTQRENALVDAQEKLADAFIRAPFDGQVAKVSVKKLDSVSSGTAVATFITNQKLAEISLNEVDVAKIKTGQKANITFDAVEGLGISGEVAEIDAVGTVSQGVVTYNIKIAFDTQDDRVKPGMSVSASIITEVKQDVLIIANSAIKSKGDNHFVEIFNPPLDPASQSPTGLATTATPSQQAVEIGIANDEFTEIISGLKEGDQIVTRTIAPSAVTAAPSAPSLFGTPRVGGGGGGSSRMPR